jgi:Major Facilitator Superfamily
MVVSHVVMVALMVAAPLHMDHHGHGLGAVGTVISLHTLGMYALAPLNGYLTDRYGSRRVLVAGVPTVGASAIVLVGGAHLSRAWFAVALFALGYGWSMTIVGGSALLVRDIPATDRLPRPGRRRSTDVGRRRVRHLHIDPAPDTGRLSTTGNSMRDPRGVTLLPILRTCIAPDHHAPDRAIMPHRRSR